MDKIDYAYKIAHRLETIFLNHYWRPGQSKPSDAQQEDMDAIDEAVVFIKNMARDLYKQES